MEKRLFGIILTVLGILGLILAAVNFLHGRGSTQNIKEITVYGIIGFIFFFAGIGLLRTTKDRAV
jgi:hypothetical protein